MKMYLPRETSSPDITASTTTTGFIVATHGFFLIILA